jgi:8-hydroxy-5-deazaflavin:NADPH oxidoreductase
MPHDEAVAVELREEGTMTTYGVLGTGAVGQAFAARLATLGHEVRMGTRDVEAARARTEPGQMGGAALAEWLVTNPTVELGTFADAIADSDVLVNATAGNASVEVLNLAQNDTLDGKILIDIGNPLDFSTGELRLTIGITDSLGETIQRAFRTLRVVKTLNTVTAAVMVEPTLVADGDHTMFVAGDDAAAKAEVTDLLASFGWRDVRDLGGIGAARGMEAYLVLWLAEMNALGTPMFNVKVVA